MRTARRVTATLSLALALAAGLTGCGSSDTDTPDDAEVAASATADAALLAQQDDLDAYVAELQKTLPAIVDGSNGMYSKIEATGTYPGTVEYEYTYTETLDADAVAAAEDTMVESTQELVDSAVFPEMARYGITIDPKVIYTYYNPDGTLLLTHTFEPTS